MTEDNLTIFDRWAAGSLTGIAKLLDLRLTRYEPEVAVICYEVKADHFNPLGTLHGGILCDVADAAMGTAWASGVKADESFTTVELKINYFRPVFAGKLTAEARVVRRGRTVGYVECDVFDDARKLVARAASTCMTLRGEQAVGR